MSAVKTILIEGYTSEEFLSLPDEQIEAFVFVGKPLVFKAGSAEILGEFRLQADRLTVELAQIEGGGEGVLATLVGLAEKYDQRRRLNQVEWIVHAVNCAKPNPKLRHVLERRGFVIENVPSFGAVYYKLRQIQQ